MRKHLLSFALAFLPLFAFAQASPPPLPAQAGHSGQYLTTNGSKASWGAVSGGTGVPGGSPDQLQWNNAGAFGGFTLGGDATIVPSTGILTVTKTNGVNFAASATTDTTNAANISSGALGTGRFPVFTGLMLDTAGTASAYAGTSCTNQFPRTLSASGVANCATVANTDLANSSVTIAGHTIALGGSSAVACGDLSNSGTACQATAPAGTIVGTTDTQTLSNKTIDTAAGNTVAVAGSSLTAATGTGGTLVLSISPTLTTPNIGAASGSSLTLTGNISAANLPQLLGTNVAGGVPWADGTNINFGTALTANALVVGTSSTGPAPLSSLGTTTTVLHGNASGLPSWGAIGTNDLAANAVTSAKMAVANTYKPCDLIIGDTSGSAITNAQLGPQIKLCQVASPGTVAQISVSADAGTPSVMLAVRHCTTYSGGACTAETITNLLSSALSARTGGFDACSNTGGTTGLDGGTTCSATLQNTSLASGDYIELVSGTAGGTAKLVQVHIPYKVN